MNRQLMRYLHSICARVVYIPFNDRDIGAAGAVIRVGGAGVCVAGSGDGGSFRLLCMRYMLPVLSSLFRSLCRSTLLIQLLHKLFELLLLLCLQVHLLVLNFALGQVNYAAALSGGRLQGGNGGARVGVRLKSHLDLCVGSRSAVPGEQ